MYNCGCLKKTILCCRVETFPCGWAFYWKGLFFPRPFNSSYFDKTKATTIQIGSESKSE